MARFFCNVIKYKLSRPAEVKLLFSLNIVATLYLFAINMLILFEEMLVVFESEGFLVFGRCIAGDFFEDLGKIGMLFKTKIKRDFFNRQVRKNDQSLRF